LLSEPTSTINA